MKTPILSILLSVVSSSTLLAEDATMTFQSSESAPAHTILLHEPGRELYLGMLHPQAALFETYFDLEKSKEEHRDYVKKLNNEGINTLLVRDVLLENCVNRKGETKEGDELEALRQFAFDILRFETDDLDRDKAREQMKYKESVINSLSAQELVDIILFQPTIHLSKTKFNTKIAACYEYSPLMNLFYTRDQSVTTPNGVVMCKMNSVQRQNECDVIKYCYNKLGITPILEIEGDGAFLEGGDYLLSNNCSYIGCGMRTTQLAINQMLINDAFGTDTVIVVKDSSYNQAQMHLDTYFNIIDENLVTLGEERIDALEGSDIYVQVDVYVKQNGVYNKISENMSFVELLKDKGITIIPVSSEDQARLANNYLTIAPRKIMAVAGQSRKFEKMLKNNNVDVKWISLENLTKGYGAAHCMTQVIYRLK